MNKIMNHSQYMKDLKGRSVDSLRHTIDDAAAAERAMPDGPNAGYYADEQHYCAMEIAQRKKDGAAAMMALLRASRG